MKEYQHQLNADDILFWLKYLNIHHEEQSTPRKYLDHFLCRFLCLHFETSELLKNQR